MLFNNTLLLCFYLLCTLNLSIFRFYAIHGLIFCLFLSICPSWEHMNLLVEHQPISAVNALTPRVHEVAGP